MKEVHIIAKGKGWDQAPEDGETWGVNDVILMRDQLALAFDLHDLNRKRKLDAMGKGLKLSIDKATKNNIPIMTLKEYDFVPTAIVYPLDDVINKFKTTYFGSSMDYMTALAIYKGFEVINFYGINMIQFDEYKRQKPSLEFWIGMAMGSGIKVNIFVGEHSSILKTYNQLMYGYCLKQFKVE